MATNFHSTVSPMKLTFPKGSSAHLNSMDFLKSGHVVLETTRFEALPGNRTRITSQSVFQSVSDRDGMIQSGMEHGVVEGYERLDEILAKM